MFQSIVEFDKRSTNLTHVICLGSARARGAMMRVRAALVSSPARARSSERVLHKRVLSSHTLQYTHIGAPANETLTNDHN